MDVVRRNLPLVFALTASAGCAVEPVDPGESTAVLTQAIVGGDETSEHPAVVGLVADDRVFCRGALIAPRAVLTAGHCLAAKAPSVVVVSGATIAVEDAR